MDDQASTPAKSPTRIRAFWTRFKGWIAAGWEWIHPRPAAQSGAGRALSITALLFGLVVGSRMSLGLHPVLDPILGLTIGFLTVRLASRVTLWTLDLIGDLPRFVERRGLAAIGGLAAVFAASGLLDAVPQGLLGIALAAAFFGGSFALIRGSWPTLKPIIRILSVLFLALSIAAAGYGLYWTWSRGDDAHLTERPLSSLQDRAERHGIAPSAKDPSQKGPHSVQTLIYGSGTDKRRPEFARAADLVTPTVDITPFVKGSDGWQIKVRHRFWGFDFENVPLNGRVWYPDGDGPFPLVLIVHGNHNMGDYSDPGYAYLGELLASRGFITVSVDQNFMNGGIFGNLNTENDGRGWLLLKHLEAWRDFAQNPDTPFHNRVDFDRIALIGHSRGGEAAAIAASFNRLPFYPDDATVAFDFNFGIRAVIAIAPSDGQYNPADRPTPLEDVNYLVLQGGHDADVSPFAGARQFHRARFSDASGEYHFKASVFIYRANHGQFNTTWGDTDLPWPYSRLINYKPLLTGDEQRQIGKLFMTAFLEASVHGDASYLPILRDARTAAPFLPEDSYITRFQDSNFTPLADYEEDIDVTTTGSGVTLRGDHLALWREEELSFRRRGTKRNPVAVVGWRMESDDAESDDAETAAKETVVPSYRFILTEETRPVPGAVLSLALADADRIPPVKDKESKEDEAASNSDETSDSTEEEKDKDKDKDEDDEKRKRPPIDFHIELASADGQTVRLPLSHFDTLSLPLDSRFSKLGDESDWYGKSWEPALQTFDLPLAAFLEAEPSFDVTDLSEIRLVFDKTEKGTILIDDVGWIVRPAQRRPEDSAAPASSESPPQSPTAAPDR